MDDKGRLPGDTPIFTDHHERQLRAAYDLLTKAFDGFVIVVLCNDNEILRETTRIRHFGGRIQAKGLLVDALSCMEAEDHHMPEDTSL